MNIVLSAEGHANQCLCKLPLAQAGFLMTRLIIIIEPHHENTCFSHVNKGENQLRCNRAADLCFFYHYIESTIRVLP